LRTLEDVMSNKCLPGDVEEVKMMKHNHLDQGIMIKATHLLRVWLFLYKVGHIFNIPEQEIREV